MTSPSQTPANSFSNCSTWAARFSGLALPSSFLTFFHVSLARRKTRRMLLRPATPAEGLADPLLELLHRPVVAGQAVLGGVGRLDDLDDLLGLLPGQKGGAAAGAAVGQGVGAVLVVAVDPAEDGLVLPADVGGAGGGVEPPGGDQVQRLEALAGARGGAAAARPDASLPASAPTWPSPRGPWHRSVPLLAGDHTLPILPTWRGTETPGLNLIAV